MEPEEDPFVLTEAEKDTLKRKRLAEEPPATQRSEEYDDEPEDIDEGDAAGEDEPDEDDDEDDQPNLQMFFDQFDIPDERVISMCRAYASYLVSLRPKTPSKTLGSRARRPSSPPDQKKRHWVSKLPWNRKK
nr:MAG: hypothetical protein [Arizlama virus]